jgi:DNA-binding YbaB/EbfC family protein
MNIQQLMKQAQAMQKKMAELQEKAAQVEMEGSAGGGMVVFTINGKGEAKKLKIDPKIVDPSDVETLEDLVIAAYNDAKRKSDEHMQQEMAGLTGGMGLPPGMKLPF